MKHWRVCVIADDPYCGAEITFSAYEASISDNRKTLTVDGIVFTSAEDGFCRLEEIN